MKKFTLLLRLSTAVALLSFGAVAFAQFPPDGGPGGGPGGPGGGPGGPGGGPGGPGGGPGGPGGGPGGPGGGPPGFFPGIPIPPPGSSHESLTAAVQRVLAKRGYYRGDIDGEFGPATRAAIRAYQIDRQLPVTGRIDKYLLRDLGL